ncbi:MAG: WHG domain-containing protein, partial [Fibrella sp.]|nr:WHG domain-containing protein [Armatimonadota bacterium]
FGECIDSNGLSISDPLLAAHTWWSNIFGLTMVLIIQGNLPDFSAPDRVVEQTIHTLWAGFQANPAVPE